MFFSSQIDVISDKVQQMFFNEHYPVDVDVFDSCETCSLHLSSSAVIYSTYIYRYNLHIIYPTKFSYKSTSAHCFWIKFSRCLLKKWICGHFIPVFWIYTWTLEHAAWNKLQHILNGNKKQYFSFSDIVFQNIPGNKSQADVQICLDILLSPSPAILSYKAFQKPMRLDMTASACVRAAAHLRNELWTLENSFYHGERTYHHCSWL